MTATENLVCAHKITNFKQNAASERLSQKNLDTAMMAKPAAERFLITISCLQLRKM